MTRRGPSDRQIQAWELTATMSRAEAGEIMGITVDGVSRLLTAYRTNTGTQRRYGVGKHARTTEEARKVPGLEAEIAALRERVAPWDRLGARLDRIEARLDALLARPTTFVPSHRRIADGGTPVKEQLREARRAA